MSGRFYHPVGVVNKSGGFPDDRVLGEQLCEWTEGSL